MALTETALKNPAGIGVVIAIVVLFGLVALSDLPVQLFPNIERPQISINANWRAASPKEIEAQILEPIETVLQGLPGMEIMEANAFNGGAWINMQFTLETDMQTTLMDVIGRLNRLPPLPADADPPRVNMGGGGGGANESLTWFFVQLLPGTEGPVEDYQQYLIDTIRPRLEAIEGVAGVEINAGADEELQITIDPYRAAQYGISIPTIAARAGRANDVSGGFIDVGRRQYTLRFEGRYSPEQLSGMVLDWRNGSPVHLGDIADIEVARGKRQGFTVQNGNPAIGIQVLKANGANALASLERVKAEVDLIREGPLKAAGLDIRQSFDASVFIKRAVAMVSTNLILGVILAIGVLWWFLRDRRATIVIATAIPISLLATAVVLYLTGRTLNVISLAGLAFAVGMVLDAAIVVSENIVRHREQGEVPLRAALLGTKQVQGALLASTATTVAIFIPVLFLQDVEGQLFADLALTIAIAVVISLFVALTVLPAMAGTWLKPKQLTDKQSDATQPGWSRNIIKFLMQLTATPTKRWSLIGGLIIGPALLVWVLMPQLDYLPPVKRDAVDAFLNMPPGATVDTIEAEVVNPIVERLAPYMAGTKEPALKNYYVIIWPGGGTIGARVQDQSRVQELETIVREEILAGIPDFQGFAAQGNLFGGFGNGRDIALHLQSVDPEALGVAAQRTRELLQQTFPGANVQMFPSIEGGQPEIRLLPRDERIVESGWDRPGVASLIRSFGNGQWLGEHFDGERRMDIIMRVGGWDTPEELASMPVINPVAGGNQTGTNNLTTLGNLVEVINTTGPGQIRRVAGRRTITVSLSPPENVSLESAVATIQSQVEPGIRQALPADGALIYGGSADSLQVAIGTMGRNFLMALGILFLLMSGLFRSLKDSLLVVLTIPLATVGGVVALRLLNIFSFQPMDLLTMIGFIILLGLVVNNAILLVDQTRRAEREGLSRDAAVEQALRLRLRPIFMSTLTSIFGMLPLLLLPAEGSVIYRGLATSIVGGMACSLVFTLLLLPSLLRLGKAKQVEQTTAQTSPLLESVA